MMRRLPDFSFERAAYEDALGPVVGIDEVGRGPLAGPVCAAAVILDPDDLPDQLDDSKKLSAARRTACFTQIMAKARAVSFASLPASEVDRLNIRQASLEAMRRACAGLAVTPGLALVDGRDAPNLICPVRTIIKGDSLSLSIAAAAIVAKVLRDAMMCELHALYPDYGFANNAGYGVQTHLQALARLGACPAHRRSFAPIKNMKQPL